MIEPRIGAMWEPPMILEKDMPEEIAKIINEELSKININK